MFIQDNGQKVISNFFSQLKPLSYKKGEIILRPDNLNPGVNFLERGHIKVYSITEDGNEKIHLIFKSGAIFPLLWIFKGIVRDTYYESMDSVVIKKVSKEDFVKFIHDDSGAVHEMINRFLIIFDVYVDRIEELEYIKTYPRLVSSLLTFSKHFGKKKGKKILIDIPLTHKDIGGLINMTRETVSRDMEKLIDKKLVTYKKHLIVIKDPIGLKRELTYYPTAEEA